MYQFFKHIIAVSGILLGASVASAAEEPASGEPSGWTHMMQRRLEQALRDPFPIGRPTLPAGVVQVRFTIDERGEPVIQTTDLRSGSMLVKGPAIRAVQSLHHLARFPGRSADACYVASIAFTNGQAQPGEDAWHRSSGQTASVMIETKRQRS